MSRNDIIKGYEDPGQTNASTGHKTYKTFTEGQRTKKFGTTAVGNPYANASYGAPEQVDESEFCPTCREQATETCNCVYSDKRCSQGHVWYVDRQGQSIQGNPHKN